MRALLGAEKPISKQRGQWVTYEGIDTMVIFSSVVFVAVRFAGSRRAEVVDLAGFESDQVGPGF